MLLDGQVVVYKIMPQVIASSKRRTGIVQHFLSKTESKAAVKVVGKAVTKAVDIWRASNLHLQIYGVAELHLNAK